MVHMGRLLTVCDCSMLLGYVSVSDTWESGCVLPMGIQGFGMRPEPSEPEVSYLVA